MNELKKQLSGEFEARLEELGVANLTSEEYKYATDGMTKIADRIIEIDRLEQEKALKEKQTKIEKRDKITRNVIEGVKVVGGMALAAVTVVVSMNFEREGTFTTQAGRSALRDLLKFK